LPGKGGEGEVWCEYAEYEAGDWRIVLAQRLVRKLLVPLHRNGCPIADNPPNSRKDYRTGTFLSTGTRGSLTVVHYRTNGDTGSLLVKYL